MMSSDSPQPNPEPMPFAPDLATPASIRMAEGEISKASGPRIFTTTQWSVVYEAMGDDGTIQPEGLEALNELCRLYQHPMYVFARRRGVSHENAQDVVQRVLCLIAGQGFLRRVDPKRGKFRNFLIAILINFIRQLPKPPLSPHPDLMDEGLDVSPDLVDHVNPARELDREITLALLAHVEFRLREELRARGKQDFFDAVKPFLSGGDRAGSFEAVAGRFEMDVGTVRVAVHRLRKRFGEILREEVRRLVRTDEEVDSELRELLLSVAR